MSGVRQCQIGTQAPEPQRYATQWPPQAFFEGFGQLCLTIQAPGNCQHGCSYATTELCSKCHGLPSTRFRYCPKCHLMETMRPLTEVHSGVLASWLASDSKSPGHRTYQKVVYRRPNFPSPTRITLLNLTLLVLPSCPKLQLHGKCTSRLISLAWLEETAMSFDWQRHSLPFRLSLSGD